MQRGSSTVVPYNFRRPDKFSKDHIRTIQSLQETFARLVNQYLAGSVRSTVQVAECQVEQSTFGELSDRLPNPTVLFVSEPEGLAGRAVIQLDMNLAVVIVDRMLGGSGVVNPRRAPIVSEVEVLILESAGKGLFETFVSAWERVAPMRVNRADVVLSTQQVHGMLLSEIVLVIRHEVSLLQERGTLSIILPASTIEPIVPRLNVRLLFVHPRSSAGNEAQANLVAQLANVPLNVKGELGRAIVRMSDLLALEPGDIIRLDTSVHSPIPVIVEDSTCFVAFPGQRAGNLAMRIVDRLDDIADDDVSPKGEHFD